MHLSRASSAAGSADRRHAPAGWLRTRSGPFTWSNGDIAPLQGIQRAHLDRLTASGRLAHTAWPTDSGPGSRSEDIAGALEVDLLHAETLGWGAVRASAWRSLRDLEVSMADETGRFRNRRDGAGDWLDAAEDDATPAAQAAHGRVVLALGEAIRRCPDRAFREAVAALLGRAASWTGSLTGLRASSAALLGCDAARRGGMYRAAAPERRLVPVLADHFERVAWSLDWPWPEPVLAQESAICARALIVAGRRIADQRMADMGLAVLEWLVRTAVAPRGHLSPIGNGGWWPQGGMRATFDQLPTEPVSIMLAAETAFMATGDRHHLCDMERAYGWFLGANDLDVEVADPERGGCRDGLGPQGCSLNQSAASTIAWLTALEHVRRVRRRWPDH